MPHTESAKKRLRQTKARTIQNKGARSALRTTEKKLRELIAAGDAAAATALLPEIYQRLDKAAKNRILHPNTAANHKRKLASHVSRIRKAPAKKA